MGVKWIGPMHLSTMAWPPAPATYMVRKAGVTAGVKAGTVTAGVNSGTASGGPESFKVWPGQMIVYTPSPLAASMSYTSTPKRAAIAPPVSPATTTTLAGDGTTVHYEVTGPLFFGSSNDLVDHFSYADDPASVTIGLSRAQIWDASTVAALDSIETKYRDHGATVTIEGLDERSTGFHRRLTGHFGA